MKAFHSRRSLAGNWVKLSTHNTLKLHTHANAAPLRRSTKLQREVEIPSWLSPCRRVHFLGWQHCAPHLPGPVFSVTNEASMAKNTNDKRNATRKQALDPYPAPSIALVGIARDPDRASSVGAKLQRKHRARRGVSSHRWKTVSALKPNVLFVATNSSSTSSDTEINRGSSCSCSWCVPTSRDGWSPSPVSALIRVGREGKSCGDELSTPLSAWAL